MSSSRRLCSGSCNPLAKKVTAVRGHEAEMQGNDSRRSDRDERSCSEGVMYVTSRSMNSPINQWFGATLPDDSTPDAQTQRVWSSFRTVTTPPFECSTLSEEKVKVRNNRRVHLCNLHERVSSLQRTWNVALATEKQSSFTVQVCLMDPRLVHIRCPRSRRPVPRFHACSQAQKLRRRHANLTKNMCAQGTNTQSHTNLTKRGLEKDPLRHLRHVQRGRHL